MLSQIERFYSFLWLSNIPLYTYIFFIHSSVDGHSDYFHMLTMVNNAVMSMGLHIPFSISVFIFFRLKSSNRIAVSYGIFIFNFLKNLHTVF